MTPQDKATELFHKYESYCNGWDFINDAKQCALIAVDEMLEFRNGLYINEGSLVHQYLLDVKQEIEKL